MFRLTSITGEALREIFQSMMEGFVVVDREGTILLANPIAEKMFGYDPKELIGKSLESLLPQRARGHHAVMRQGFNTNPTPRPMGLGRDLMALKKNGVEFPVEISLSYSHAGGSFVAIAFISDITLRKKAEEALKQSEEQLIVYAAELEKKVKSRTEDLNNTIKKLEKEVTERKRIEEELLKALEKERDLNDMKSKFVSIASHEFRTPLSTILSSLTLIEQYRQLNQADKIDKHVSRAQASVNHMTAILNDFLSLGRLEEGKIEINLEQVDVRSLLNEISEEIQLILKPDQRLNVDFAPSSPDIRTDSRILRNVLFNLLSNASKYSEKGKTIYISCQRTEHHLAVSIRDEGIGIPEDEQRHLFDRFFRASNALNIQGTGLGLNIVKRYLDFLKGTISFTSLPGKGSTFTIQLPIKLQ